MFALMNEVCIDNDRDGYYSDENFICGTIDCNDNDATINPGVTEIFGNGKDDDCNPVTPDIFLYNTWNIETVDSNGNVGLYTSIALDSEGNIHIGYVDKTNGYLKHALFKNGTWEITTVDNSTNVGNISLVIDSNDYVHISYYDKTNKFLKYATNVSGQWESFIVDDRSYSLNIDGVYDNDTGLYNSLALNSNDKPYILYYVLTADNKPRLYIATTTSGYPNKWERYLVDYNNQIGGVSFSIDSSDRFHIVYYRIVTISTGTYYHVVYKTGYLDCTDGTYNYPWARWSSIILDNIGDVGKYPSIALDTLGKVHISYYDASNKALKYATNTSGKWVIQTIDQYEGGEVGQYTSIALDSSNKVYISYYDNTAGNLKLATNLSGTWSNEIVDNLGDVGAFSSIFINNSSSDVSIHISYYDSTNGNLKYATTSIYDNDGDGYLEIQGDCDDTDPNVNPGASEICDGKDTDCDGWKAWNDVDADGDGYPQCAGDCNDNDPNVYPGNIENCTDGIDNDCDSLIDSADVNCIS